MSDGGDKPMTSYERKIHLIMESSMKRFNGEYTQEQYDLELTVARNMLTALGIRP